ncbi:DUF1656 domain-containing protein [Marichromatium bheemlicum]|uniref:DUF1656 domain-containing protein n=1 Tax=Marichromatium bheemlicum TaxID=365339 RepID=A0ABX1IAQ1_9GAMM|nr:DUF1656 domain-containing protein [Marichromatium bheemlicum]NKN34276.1 DUF1656 domain-containing protein [Marichromatium bheemlicum]
MSGELNLFGVYLHAELVTSTIALALTLVVNRVLIHFGLYRHLWHQALFEVAVFVILWALVVKLSSSWLL